MILIERSKFALLVRSHMKASNMLLVLQHVCRERRISLSMTQEEVCQLIRLDPDFVEKYKRRGKLCPVEEDRKSTRLNSSHNVASRMPSSA